MSAATELVTREGEVLDVREVSGALEAITRAEIDVQVATARRYPRSPEKFLKSALAMVSISPELAAQCRYSLPARAGSRRPIEGPSVRLAEIVATCWGNLRIVGRITGDDGRCVTAQAVALDLEANLGYQLEVRRGVTTRDGRRYAEDQVRQACQAAVAIATRNAIFKVVPRAFVALVEDHARKIARGDERSLPERASMALDWYRVRGIADAEVFRVLAIDGPADLTLEQLEWLNGLRTAIQDGQATLEEIFRPAAPPPRTEPQGPAPSRTEALRRRLTPPEPAYEAGTAGRITSEDEPHPGGPAAREPGADG